MKNKKVIKEKIKLLSGKSFWDTYDSNLLGIKSIKLSDGPLGIRKQESNADNLGLYDSVKSVCYPSTLNQAQTFNKDLMKTLGNSLASDAINLGVDVILSPAMNIKRSPLGGRNFEYFSEDPYLTGKMAGYLVKGIEEKGVGSCLKHYALNSQETLRMISNSNCDLNTLNELYLRPFEIAIKEGNPSFIMSSYNKINGIYASENEYLLKDKLRRDFKFSGSVVTDWGALNNPYLSYKNGLNLEMPGYDRSVIKEIYKAYKKGLISIDEIDLANKPLIEFSKRVKVKENYDLEKSLKVSEDVAKESIVLLKNEDNILPLKKDEDILIVGEMADNIRYQGAGSSKINPINLINLIDAYKLKNTKFDYLKGYTKDFKDDLTKASNYSKVIVLVGLPDSYESEGYDRKDLDMPKYYIDMISDISKINPNVVVLILSGSPILMPFKDNVKGIIYAGLLGERGAFALYDTLYGINNPSGRLAQSFYNSFSDIRKSVLPKKEKEIYYTEGMYVGYKDLIKRDILPLYPFGYGLSYSNIEYQNIKLNDLILSFDITSKGYDSSEVIQIYLEKDKYKWLIYFDKVKLSNLETKNIKIDLNKLDEAYKYKGRFKLSLSKDAITDIKTFDITLNGKDEFIVPSDNITFEIKENKKEKLNLNSTLLDINQYFIGRRVYKLMNFIVKKYIKKHPEMEDIINSMILEVPFRAMAMGTNYKLNRGKLKGLILIIRGRIISGLFKMIFS